jgi:hypothetical protein
LFQKRTPFWDIDKRLRRDYIRVPTKKERKEVEMEWDSQAADEFVKMP